MTLRDKDPDAVLDYGFDWSDFLGDDTIASSTWTLSAGNPDTDLEIDSNLHTDTLTTVWVSGGSLNKTYALTNHVTTSSGREDDRTLKIRIKEK